jgi:hypothetical protein
VPDLICSTCGKQIQDGASSVCTPALCPACMAATVIATPEDAAIAKITTHADASEGSFREGTPPPVPVPPSLDRRAIRGALIFAASGVVGAIMGYPCLLGGVSAGQGAKLGMLTLLAVCFGPSLGIGAALVGLLLRVFDSPYAGRVPLAGPAAFLIGALPAIPLALKVADFSSSIWSIPITLILANAACGALFGAIRCSLAPHLARPLRGEGRERPASEGAATAFATPKHAAQAKTSAQSVSGDGSFREGPPPHQPVPAPLSLRPEVQPQLERQPMQDAVTE